MTFARFHIATLESAADADMADMNASLEKVRRQVHPLRHLPFPSLPILKPYKIADSAGLHLVVGASGGTLWRYRYEFGGKEKVLSIGAYPGVSVADARKARDDARQSLKSGRDPWIQRKLAKLRFGAARLGRGSHRPGLSARRGRRGGGPGSQSE